jgi:hypothetical protein
VQIIDIRAHSRHRDGTAVAQTPPKASRDDAWLLPRYKIKTMPQPCIVNTNEAPSSQITTLQ